MRKILLLGTLAFLAGGGAASAATTVTLDGFCNAYNIRNYQGLLAAKDIGCSSAIGAGVIGSVHLQGKTAIIGLQDPASPGHQFVFKFSYPFTSGGTWSLNDTIDGKFINPVATGNYSLGAPGGREAGPKSATSR